MSKTLLIAIGAVVLVALVVAGLFFAKRSPTPSSEKGEMKKDEAMVGEKMEGSRYVEYSKAAFDKAADKRRVLYFYANWCPTCRPADLDLSANKSQIPKDIIVFRVNYNDSDTDQEEKDLATKHGVTYQHTFVQIDTEGAEVTKWNGGQTPELLANIKST